MVYVVMLWSAGQRGFVLIYVDRFAPVTVRAK